MEKENSYMKQLIDWKRIWVLFGKKIWLIVLVTIAGAFIGALGYKLVETVTSEGQFYRVSSDYYIFFNEDDNGVDYYNAYTWDNILRDDPVVDVVMENIPSHISREEVKAAVTGEMVSDYRVLTVHVTSLDSEAVQIIADAYEVGLVEFANRIDLLNKIELWSQGEIVPVIENDYMINVGLFSGVASFCLILLLVSVFYILDDSIYLEKDFTQRFTIPFLGMITKARSPRCKQELKDNLAYICKEGDTYHLVAWDNQIDMETVDTLQEMQPSIKGSVSVQGKDLDVLRASDGAILVLPWAGKNGRIAKQLVCFLEKQDITIAGAVLTDADDTFLKAYYFGNVKRK